MRAERAMAGQAEGSVVRIVFIRRVLLHVLPVGFVKIRHFELLANRNRREALARCRLHLRATASVPTAMLTEQQRARSMFPTMQTRHSRFIASYEAQRSGCKGC
jgi:hypothetical protein